MTFWAKLLTIVAFVLSLVFATMSGVIFTKRNDFRALLKAEKVAHESDVKKYADEIAEKDLRLESKEADLGNANTKISSLTHELETTRTERDSYARQLKDQTATTERFRTSLDKYVRDNEATMARNKELIAYNKKVEGENRKLMAALTEERKTTSNLEKVKADLENERDGLKAGLAKANEHLKLNEEAFAELRRRHFEVRQAIDKIKTLPTVKAKVVTVDTGAKVVVLNVGRKDGVKKNFTFTIFRGPKFVGTVNIFDLNEEWSAGHIELANLPMQRGDDAWTRLP